MLTHSYAALALLQTSEVSAHDIHLMMIFVGIIALALLVAAGGLVFTSIFAAKLLHSVNCVVKEAKEHTGPLLVKTNQLVHELAPKIHHLTENAEQISYTVRTKMDELAVTVSQLNETVQEVNGRARRQVAHADGIVTDALNGVQHVSQTVQDGIRGPLKQVVGVVAGIKAGIEKLVERSPFSRP